MFIIDFRQTRREAFVHGFVKGLGAPALLFHCEAVRAVPSVLQVSASHNPIDQALLGDWYKVGNDFKTVVARHQESSLGIAHKEIHNHGRQSHKPTSKKSGSKRR